MQAMRRLLFIPAVAALVFVTVMSSRAQTNVSVVIDGSPMSFSDQPPLDQSGRIFVPMRAIFERLGAEVIYNNGTINATRGSRTVALAIGSQSATVNGQPVQLDSPPFLIGDRTLVPLRFVSQALGARVSWDENRATAFIDTNGMAGYEPGYQPGYVQAGAYGGLNLGAGINLGVYVNLGPPSLPAYSSYEPAPPGPGYIWQPGYWGWGSAGWYWVPGTWMQPPQTGLYWTPGYWSYNDWCGCYGWNPGYWAQQVGFYGGINYGFGYYGDGYVGGSWQNGGFYYNRAVVPNVTSVTIIHNVYYNESAIRTHTVTSSRVAFNGSGGVSVRPTSRQLAVARMPHVSMTSSQVQHAQWAAKDRTLLYNVNHGHPATVAVAHPFSATRRPPHFTAITASDQHAAAAHVLPPTKVKSAAATHHVALPATALKYQAPVAHPAPAVHAAPAAVHRPPAVRVVHPAPAIHPTIKPHVVHPATPMHTVHPAPAVRPAAPMHVVRPAPAMHTPHPAAMVHRSPHPKPKNTPTPR